MAHMNRFILAVCVSIAFCFSAPAFAAPRPNVVIFIADDLGYGELGCQGNPQIPTPHIDSIANDGIRFTQGYVTAAYCSASRAGLMTGRYQTRFGYEYNPIGAENEDPRVGLPKSEITLAKRLRDAGYATGLIGKWHLGGSPAQHPLTRGFDYFFGFTHEGHYFVPPPYDGVTTWLRRKTLPDGTRGDKQWTRQDGKLILTAHMGHDEPSYDANNPIVRNSQPVDERSNLTDAFTRESTAFIDRHADRPFLLVVSYNAVHSPMQGDDRYMKKFAHIKGMQRRIFAAMLSHMDDSVGAVLGKLRDKSLEDNTLVFFLSDNGGPTRELTSSNAPLRGGKGDMYEGGIRVPFLVKWPSVLPNGKVEHAPVISLDIYATAWAAAVDRPNLNRLDGVNLTPYLTGQTSQKPHKMLFWRQGQRTAIRVGDLKLVRNPRGRSSADWALYDLAKDAAEQNDLSTKAPHSMKTMREAWQELDDAMIEPTWRRGE